ncbi:class I SAM-dependent methyltransferase [Candidatus Pelagibacter sp.]|nr:class I SAM-dependent methyltransferase [Candidatus Pelagibacter sp.]
MNKLLNEKFLSLVRNLSTKKDKKDIKILDWGCGNGNLVKFLNDHGYDCYGLEIVSNKKIKSQLDSNNDKNLIDKIFFISDDNITKFQSNYFDIVITNQVIEHMSNKNGFIEELKRILRIGGFSYNILPAKFRFIEVHLKMPFVHWFPKNVYRKYMILFFNLFKFNHWAECKNLSFYQQVEYYYEYSTKKTFYSSANSLFNNFRMKGFYVNDCYLKNKILNNIFIQFIKKNFISIEFLAIKK